MSIEVGVLVTRLPLLTVWLAGLLIAVRQRELYPGVSRMMIVALGTLLVTGFADSIISPQLAAFAQEKGWSVEEFGRLLFIKGATLVLITAGAWALVIGAALRDRAHAANAGT